MVELMAAIIVIAAVGSIALETVDNFFSAQRVQAEALTFIQDIRGARYGAMAEQVFHRLIFNAERTAYKVQKYEDIGAIPMGSFENDAKVNYNSGNWHTVIEEQERVFDPLVTVEIPTGLAVFFMRPDGMLVDTPANDAPPLGDFIATFSYGASTLQVNVNCTGVFATQEYYEEY